MLPSPVTFLKNHACSRPQHRIICMEDAQRIPWFPHINPGCCENIWCLRLHEPGFSLLMNKMAGPWWLPRNREIKKYINMLFHSQINKTVYVISSAGSIHGCSLLWKVTRWHLSESKLQSDGLGKGFWLSQTPDSLPLKQKANRMTHRNAHLSIQWLWPLTAVRLQRQKPEQRWTVEWWKHCGCWREPGCAWISDARASELTASQLKNNVLCHLIYEIKYTEQGLVRWLCRKGTC